MKSHRRQLTDELLLQAEGTAAGARQSFSAAVSDRMTDNAPCALLAIASTPVSQGGLFFQTGSVAHRD